MLNEIENNELNHLFKNTRKIGLYNENFKNPVILTTYYGEVDFKKISKCIEKGIFKTTFDLHINEHVIHKYGEYYLVFTDIFHKFDFDVHYFVHDLYILPIITGDKYIYESHNIIMSEIESKYYNNVISRTKYYEKPILENFKLSFYDESNIKLPIPKELLI